MVLRVLVVKVYPEGPLTSNNVGKSAAAARKLKRWVNLYPPYLGAAVRVTHIAENFRRVEVEMPLRFYNRNYVGTHFGGSLYSMVDPFYMLMLINILGPDYIVWDKAGAIDFIAPGREDVFAEFVLEDAVLDELRAATAGGEKHLRWFEVDIKTAGGELVAKFRKQLYVRKRPKPS